MKRLVVLAIPLLGAAVGQQPQQPSCQIVVDRAAFRPGHDILRQLDDRGQLTMLVGGGFEAHCENDSTRITSDSAYYVQASGNLQFIGTVRFRDSVSTLDADHVTYFLRQERLIARGNVYTRNIRNGSDLRGPNLDYLRAVPSVRDTSELFATGRPTITFYPPTDSATPPSQRPLPFIIIGDRVRMRHSNQMWGAGNVTINRPDLAARADSAELNLRDSAGVLIGAPWITGRDSTAGARDTSSASDTSFTYRLAGQRIDFALTTNQQVKRVQSKGDAVAIGVDWRLTADTLLMDVDSGQIQRTQAWGDENRPVAVSGASTITADSMDIRMPGQKMQLVWAWGSSRASSRPDSLATGDDWLTGDSLRADFAERPTPQDSSRLRTEISEVTSYGNARAFYHVEQDNADSTVTDRRRGINYSRGDRITIAMRARRVQTVDIVGKVDGVYLEPVALRDTARDTTAARETTATRDTATRDTTARGRP